MVALRQFIKVHAHAVRFLGAFGLCTFSIYRWVLGYIFLSINVKKFVSAVEALLHGSPYIYLRKTQMNSDGKMRCHKEFIILPFK